MTEVHELSPRVPALHAPLGHGSKLSHQDMDRRFSSMFPFSIVRFWVPIYPQPLRLQGEVVAAALAQLQGVPPAPNAAPSGSRTSPEMESLAPFKELGM